MVSARNTTLKESNQPKVLKYFSTDSIQAISISTQSLHSERILTDRLDDLNFEKFHNFLSLKYNIFIIVLNESHSNK